MKKNKAFTLIELIAVLVILAIISLIVAPLILNIISRVKDVANKRSIDGYGRAIEYAMANYQLKHLTYPDTFDKLEIEYKGNKVECKTSRINPDYSIYLSECKVNGRLVKDDKEVDGYYHYGILKMTNQEYVDTYGKNLEDALKSYYDEHNEYPSDYTTLELPPLDKEVSCDVEINCDGTVYLSACNVNDEEVTDYVYGKDKSTAVKCLLDKTNEKSITNYTDGNAHEMYTFDHVATEQTPALTDYRYIGNVPYNYAKFNGDETWRIIGVFSVDDGNGNWEERVKIVRNQSLDGKFKYDDNGTNDWEHSSTCSYLNDNYYISLSSDFKSYVNDAKYYLGGVGPWNGCNSDELYGVERGTVSAGNRNIFVVNKIGLIYPSDYLYTFYFGVDTVCAENFDKCKDSNYQVSWLYSDSEWTISPSSYLNATNRAVSKSKGLVSYSFVSNTTKIRPTFYLKPEVKIKSGDGTIDNPYEFEL